MRTFPSPLVMYLLKATALRLKMDTSGSKSGPADAVANVRSADLCDVVKVRHFVMLVLSVLNALSLAGATSHP